MMNLKLALSAVTAALLGAPAWAAPILPDASGFGPLTVATFGGSGIPHNAVAQTTFNGVTIGLTATPRFTSPAVSNDGAGTFRALPGEDTVNPNASSPLALWNFDYYISTQSTSNPLNYYNYRIYYDFNPAAGNDISTHGFFNAPGVLTAASPFQGSENLGANFLAVSSALIGLTAPPGATLSTFNPFAPGEYTFKIAAFQRVGTNLYGQEIFNTSMAVVVPTPAPWAALLAGLIGLGAMRHRARVANAK